jgi:YVTN family beta-propeller protein
VLLFSNSAYADRFAYVVNSLLNDEALSRINLTTGEVTNNIVLLGEAPNQVVINGDSTYVINSTDDDIQVIDLTTETTVAYIDIGAGRNPFHMAFADERYAYVTNWQSHTISKVDVVGDSVVGEYGVGMAPEGLVVVDDKLYVCCTGFQWTKYNETTGREWVFDPTQRTNDVKAYAYITGQIYVFDLQSETVIDSISVGMNPRCVDTDPEGELNVLCTGDYWSVFGQIYRIDPNTDAVIDSIYVGGSPVGMSIGSDGVGYLAAGGWNPDPGLIYTFDSHADTMIRGESNPITTDCGVIAVTALYPSQVLSCNFDADNVSRMKKDGTLLYQYLVGNGPVSVAVYTPSAHIPLLSQGSLILLIALLALAGTLVLKKSG